MEKLLLIADDLTGALDAGIAFAAAGISTCVGQDDYFVNSRDAADNSVVVTVLPTRHISKEAAYIAVYDVVKKAVAYGFDCIYKKTDSALRGNIGCELEAALNATGERTLYFVPAFPKMNRVTRNGVQYIDGTIPVAESVFGEDSFNPVRHSAVADILAETSNVPVCCARTEAETYADGVAVFDAETDNDIVSIAGHIFSECGAKLVAGCAGFAGALPSVLNLKRNIKEEFSVPSKLITFCGSINPISLNQCDVAEKKDAPRFHLICENGFADERTLIDEVTASASQNQITILDTGSTCVDTQNMDAVQSGKLIAEKMSRIICGVSEQVSDATMFIIGGDTLIAFINSLGIETIVPVEEVFPGVVLAKYHFHDEWKYLISKSGGFGEPDLLEQISRKLSSQGKTDNAGGE